MAEDAPEHAVIVHLVLSDGDMGIEADQARMWELEDQLAAAIDAAQVGQYDGNEFAEGEAVLYMYGPSSDSLFDVVRPLLGAFTPLSGSHVIKRYGSAEDLGLPGTSCRFGSRKSRVRIPPPPPQSPAQGHRRCQLGRVATVERVEPARTDSPPDTTSNRAARRDRHRRLVALSVDATATRGRVHQSQASGQSVLAPAIADRS